MFDVFKKLGFNFKCNPCVMSDILPQLYSISTGFKTDEIKLIDLRVTNISHAAFTDSNLDSEYLFAINLTGSPKIHGSVGFVGADIPLCPLKNDSIVKYSDKLIKPGFFAISYSHKNYILSADGNMIIKKILINSGLSHYYDALKAYNMILTQHKLNYINNMILKKNNVIILNDLDRAYSLKNKAYSKFMLEHDSNNILLELRDCYKDDDFVFGFNLAYNVLGAGFISSLSYYGNEGLEYFNQENELIRYLSDTG
jgi:hypothetical protein